MSRTDFPRNEKSNGVPKQWTKHKPKVSGFYLIKGKHWVYKFDYHTALVDVEKRKVYMSSVHCGYNLDRMFSTIFVGPFFDKEELLNARNKIEGRDC